MPAEKPALPASSRRPLIQADDLTAAITYILAALIVVTAYIWVTHTPCPDGEELRRITWSDRSTTVLCVTPP